MFVGTLVTVVVGFTLFVAGMTSPVEVIADPTKYFATVFIGATV